ncbi:MAG: TonB-dependent receptor [Bacteroidota bacterium]
MKKILTFVIVFFALLPQAVAQSASVGGSVVEQSTKQPIEFSSVALYRTSDSSLVAGTVTDAAGKFVLKNLQEGSYYLAVQFLGYEPKKISPVGLTKNHALALGVISLAGNQKLLQELVVNGEKAASVHTIDKQVYKASQFQAAQGGTATDVLKNLPSVSVNSEGDISMRGSASFIVLLDGKPVQSDAAMVLNQLPANAVENVEIITTPSSKYDPDGKAGIINITTKKGATDGLYLLVNAQLGAPSIQDYSNEKKPQRFGGDFTANYKKQQWSLSLGANYKREDIAGLREGQAQTFRNNILTDFPSLGERSYASYSYSVRGTVNYAFNKANSLEAGFYTGRKSQFRTANLLYRQKRIDQQTGEEINSFDYFNKNLRERKGDFAIANLGYTHTFPNKATLAVSGLYESTLLGGPTKNQDVNPDVPSHSYTNSSMEEENPLDGFRLKADYALPVGKKGKFETGYQYRYVLHTGTFSYSQLDLATNSWTVRPELSNEVKLTRKIHSVYGQFANEVGKLSYSAGLRLEYTDRTLVEATALQPHNFERVNLFPSANLLYTLAQGYQLKAGYSRRIVHTVTSWMNPFLARRHSETIEVGDPDLLPEYIDVAEAGVVKNFGNNSVFANLYYQGTQNVINRVNKVYSDTILFRTYTNSGNATALGIEWGVDLKPFPWWSLSAGGNVYRYGIKGATFNQPVNTHSINYSINANTTFRILSSLSLQLAVNYTSQTVTAQGEDSRFLIPSATLKKTLLAGRANLSLQWSNIDLGMHESNRQRITARGNNFYSSTNYIQEVDIVRINFSYQLNKLIRKVNFTQSEFGEKEF